MPRVTGIEIDPEAAEIAAKYCEGMIVGDIERMDLSELFSEERSTWCSLRMSWSIW